MAGYDDDSHFSKANIFNPEATRYCPNNNPLIRFAGRDWWINYHWSQNTGTWADEPFKSIFDPKIVKAATDHITLQILPNPANPSAWLTSEIVLLDKLGYGKYLITAKTDAGGFADLDAHAVFGAFLYQYSEAPPDQGPNIHREIDFLEVLRSGEGNAQFTLQPWDGTGNTVKYFKIPPGQNTITIETHWYPSANGLMSIFHCYLGDYTLANLPPYNEAVGFWRAENRFVPQHTAASCERLHINLWLMHGAAPSRPQSATITRFEFQPHSG